MNWDGLESLIIINSAQSFEHSPSSRTSKLLWIQYIILMSKVAVLNFQVDEFEVMHLEKCGVQDAWIVAASLELCMTEIHPFTVSYDGHTLSIVTSHSVRTPDFPYSTLFQSYNHHGTRI